MTKFGLLQFLLLLLVSPAFGQKVKYKDIYALLSTKQYEQAEPFLKAYLRENTDNPNAFLFMGHIHYEKGMHHDVLKETTQAVANMDSAVLFYDKALKILDDREVRKNKEYYESYNRRDLRTGEFGVKLSDIQFDVQKRMEGLKERVDRVKMVKHFFTLADTTYQQANSLYMSLRKKYASATQLYLRADEGTLKDLTALGERFDAAKKAFEQYKTALGSLGKTGYNQQMTVTDIAEFTRDGALVADLYQDDVRWWNYSKFGAQAKEVIEKEILPTREHLVAYDMEINKLRDKLTRDSVSVRNDLTKLIDRMLEDQLKKYDPEPLPVMVFGLKTADLEYRSLLVDHKALRDSANIALQIAMLGEELKVLSRLDSIASRLPEEKIDEKVPDYAAFVNSTYSNTGVLKSYIRSLREFGLRQQREKSALVGNYRKALNYIVDGSDSIPLIEEMGGAFRPLVVEPEKFTLGVSLRDSAEVKGYFYTITPSRKADVKAFFPVEKSAVSDTNLSATKALTWADPAGQIYYVLIYSEAAQDEKFPSTVAKIYRSDGLAWKTDYPLAFAPSELVLSADTGELVIRSGTQEAAVDKNGKVVR